MFTGEKESRISFGLTVSEAFRGQENNVGPTWLEIQLPTGRAMVCQYIRRLDLLVILIPYLGMHST